MIQPDNSKTNYSLPVCIIQNDRIIFCNQEFLDLTGFSKDFMSNIPDSRFLFQKDDYDSVREKMAAILNDDSRIKPFNALINTRESGLIYVDIQLTKTEFNGATVIEAVIQDRSTLKALHGFFSYREKYLNDILSNPFLAFNIVDHNGYLTFFNEGSSKLVGYAGYEVLGKHYKILYPESFDIYESSRVIKSDESGAKIIETRYRHKKGHLIPVQLHITRLEDEDKNLMGYLGVAFDISEGVKNREAIKKRNKELQNLVMLSETITETLDLNKTINEALVNIQQNFDVDYVEIFVSEDGKSITPENCQHSGIGESLSLPAVIEHIENCPKCLATNKLYCPLDIVKVKTHEINHKTIHIKNSILILPLTEKHRYIGILCFYRTGDRVFTADEKLLFSSVASQISAAIYNGLLYMEQKEDAKLFAAINEIQLVLTANLNPDKLAEEIVTKMRILVGCNHVSISYFDPYEYWHVQAVSSKQEIDQVFNSGTRFKTDSLLDLIKVKRYNYIWDSQDNVLHDSKILAKYKENGFKNTLFFPIVSEGKCTGTLQFASYKEGVFNERLLKHLNSFIPYLALSIKNAFLITDLGSAYEHLKHAQDIIVRTERLRALGEMSAGVAHDFNNILGAIYARAQMLETPTDPDKLEQGLMIIAKAAKDGAETVRRLQEFTRIRKDQEFEPIHLEEMLKDVLSMTNSRWKKDSELMNIKTDIITEFEKIPPIMGNPSEFREALINIFLNSYDAMPESGSLTVKTFKQELNDQTIIVGCSIKDTGMGMSKEVQSRIFDPFFTTKGAKGSGLGMSLVYGIVRRHKGNIKVESEEGKGTEITLTFPPAKDDVKEKKVEVQTTTSNASRILVVDDNVEISNLIKDILENEGHTIENYGCGEDGIDAFKKRHFDIVISDLGLPTISGWEIADQVKQINPSIPIILITGWGMQLNEEDLKKHRIELVLSKPFDMFKLIDVINTALKKETKQL